MQRLDKDYDQEPM